jgi:hypothetical protein
MTCGFAAVVTNSLAVAESKSLKKGRQASSCDLYVQQRAVSPARKTGLIRTKSRSPPIAGAAGPFVSSIRIARDLSPAENGTLIPGKSRLTIRTCFNDSRLMSAARRWAHG